MDTKVRYREFYTYDQPMEHHDLVT
jgi:hypothetical protein